MSSLEQVQFLVKGRLMKQPSDLSPTELANLSTTIWNEYAVPGAK
jgi:hypothetical protein